MVALSPKQLAERWHCSVPNIYKQIKLGKLPTLPIRPYRVSMDVVRAMETCGLSDIEGSGASDSRTGAEPQPDTPPQKRTVLLPNGRRMRVLDSYPRR